MSYNLPGIVDSYNVSPTHRATVILYSPFRSFDELKDIKEVYIKDRRGRKTFFVTSANTEEYSEPQNIFMLHMRNLYWNLK